MGGMNSKELETCFRVLAGLVMIGITGVAVMGVLAGLGIAISVGSLAAFVGVPAIRAVNIPVSGATIGYSLGISSIVAVTAVVAYQFGRKSVGTVPPVK
jgi:ribose/xylose/arabinose/galactoside ABC-type transport system permease subunit